MIIHHSSAPASGSCSELVILVLRWLTYTNDARSVDELLETQAAHNHGGVSRQELSAVVSQMVKSGLMSTTESLDGEHRFPRITQSGRELLESVSGCFQGGPSDDDE